MIYFVRSQMKGDINGQGLSTSILELLYISKSFQTFAPAFQKKELMWHKSLWM